jgi:hypothetical protein
MARKSLVIRVLVDTALASHNCQANEDHRIKKGDVRLKVRKGRSWDHYCRECADAMIVDGIQKLEGLKGLPLPVSVARR